MSPGGSEGQERRDVRPLAVALALAGGFMVVEALSGWLAGSLALLSDAGHMAADVLGLGMALAALLTAERASRADRRTYGLYRAEILGALANALLLFLVAGYVLFEAVRRLDEGKEIHVGAMAVVGCIGLVVNVTAFRLLRGGARRSLNVEGAYLEVVADLVGSLGVVVAAAVIWLTGWKVVDPLVGAAIGVFILPRAWRFAGKALRILLQVAPAHVDLDALRARLGAIPGIVDVHDLHVWTLTSEMDVGTVHLMTREGVAPGPVLDEARAILSGQGIGHATLQVEPESQSGCAELRW